MGTTASPVPLPCCSTDWPFENIDHAARWFDAAPISEADRLKIGRTTAAALFRLSL
jgi:2,3-dihydroxybenzoate decarboxylase